MKQSIVELVKKGEDVVIIGPSDSGKTYFVINKLIPGLEGENLRVAYFEDGDHIDDKAVCDVVIFDEAETLSDQESIENQDGTPYPREYLDKVANWGVQYKVFNQPAIFIVSRKVEDAQVLVLNPPIFRHKPCRAIVFK